MLRLAFAHFIRLCRLNISFFILSLVCLTCAFTSFLFIQEFGYYKYTEVIEREQETQVLYFMCSDDTTAQDVYFRLDSDRFFPELSSVTISSDQYAGIDWGESGDWYTPYGRFFRYEEIESGAAAAILGTCYIQSLPQESIDSVWETEIEISGTHFDAIGSHYFHTSADGAVPKELYATQIPAPIVIPLRSFWEEGLAANKLRCVFSAPLTKAQIARLQELLQSYAGIHSVSMPREGNFYAIKVFAEQVVPYTLIIILSMISIGAVILHWLRREFVRYRIYIICGARRSQIAFLLSFAIIMLMTIAFFFAGFIIAGITELAPAGVLAPLPWPFYAAIYGSVLFITLLGVHMKAFPLHISQQDTGRVSERGCCYENDFHCIQTSMEAKVCKSHTDSSNFVFRFFSRTIICIYCRPYGQYARGQ